MKRIGYILFIILSFLMLFTSVNATPLTRSRIAEDNYGVNKKWDMTSSRIQKALKTPLVDASEKIYDFAEILTDEEEEKIYKIIHDYIEHTNMDMIFVSVNIPYYSDKQNEDYATDFYDYNDFGLDFDKYSGVLLLRNTYESDPYYNVYTFGEAQLYYPLERCDSILDGIYNDFHSHNYSNGLKTFVKEMTKYYDKGIPKSSAYSYVDEYGVVHTKEPMPWFAIIVAAIVITAITIGILVSKNKMIRKAVKAQEYLVNGSVNYTIKNDKFISTHTTSHVRSSSSSSGGSGRSSIGSSGGGHGGGSGRHG